MESFSSQLNEVLVDTFSNVLKYEEDLLKSSANTDLSISEMHLIEDVGKNKNDGKTISDLAASQKITLPSVTIAINKLAKKGYVVKEKSSIDGRVVYVRLTDKGLRIDKIHQYFHMKMVKEITRQMTDDEKEVLIQGMEKLNRFFAKKISRLSDK
ncbi:winged helix DNA-binding protein [Acetobacterium fimetarium]|uniref:HTH-type transcriptional regulator SarZ n=1 Tax=Acetobacterium fimetarium TaxID=52691 RepID=A0ABR6WRA6_9FIRM|nr:winged helix DNA-binding protein [Acetobacterium fimetarium]MBC3803166.1 winged helix DNA-binding protein [Acetobacterium fimetarium]